MAWPPAAWALALLLAALASALAAGAFWGLSLIGLAVTLLVTIGHAVLFGLPVALYFRRRGWMHRLPAAIAGGVLVGAIPIGVLTAGSLVLNGMVTASNLKKCLEIAGIGGALGAPGGLAFWLTLRAFGKFR